MFDIGWSELLVIGVVALIVVGPKDLPKMFRTLGQVTAKLRGMAREFSRAMDSAADEAGVKDIAKSFRETASGKSLKDAVGFDDIEREFRDIGAGRSIKPVDKPVSTPSSTPASSPAGAAKTPSADGDPDLSARNAAAAATEAERLARAQRAAESRRRAADIRAARAAEAAPTPSAGDDADRPQG